MEIKLVPTEQSDFALMLELLKQAALRLQRKGLDQWQNWLNPTEEDESWIQDGFEKQEFFFIQNQENKLIGTLRIMQRDLLYWGAQPERAFYIHSLTVLDDYSGLGIGQRVIDQVAGQAAQAGCKWLRLDCNAGNPALCDYYEKQGFKQVGVRVFDDFSCNLYQRKV